MLEIKELSALGLSETEARVYLDLASLSKATPQVISKRTDIARTTVYWALDNLVAKGLVSLTRKRSSSFYTINQPQSLVRMVQDEKRKVTEELKNKEEIAKKIAASIQPLISGFGALIPTVQFFEGQKGVNAMLYDFLETWQQSIEKYDFTWWGYQDHTFAEDYFDWLKHTWDKKKEGEIYKVVTNESGIENVLKEIAPHRRVKFVPEEYGFSSTIWVLGDYIVLIMTNEKPHYALQFQNQAFAANLRTVFKMLWEMALKK
jgi:sugar-specific transcriptional regulator TrmB